MSVQATERRLRTAAGALVLGVLIAAGAVPAGSEAAPPPNIVFVLTDDLSWDLVRLMPQVRRLQHDGMTFRQFVVSDSLCCSSRATILTGQFPHNTHVLGNTEPDGGYPAFRYGGARRRSVGIALQRAGYRTALLGKYLNLYFPYRYGRDPGWNEWVASSWAYGGFGYRQSDNGHPMIAGFRPRDYVTDVLARRAARFIRSAGRHPFFALVATYAPHRPYTPAPRHRSMFRNLRLPRGGAFNASTRGAPRWLGRRRPLTGRQQAHLVRVHRMRARSVQAVDEMIGRLRATVRATGVARNTYFVFSSDNGYHLGQHRLMEGKRTAFDDDLRVPLIIAGPGVPAGSVSRALTGTVDLAPTFEDWAGRAPDARRDGRSLAPLLDGTPPQRWRRALLVEHTERRSTARDPDSQGWAAGPPVSYTALRTAWKTYVEYADGDREYYDRRSDPFELHNRVRQLSPWRLARLSAALARYRRCHGATECRAAGRVGRALAVVDNGTRSWSNALVR
jgi:arylsulfatase A-like enzyme